MNLIQEQLSLIATQFHWLRPLWLLSLIPVLLLSIFLWRQRRRSHQWQHIIAPELLPYLIDGKTVTAKKSLLWLLIFAWLASAIALAGPSWIKRPMPVEKNQDALVILLDLSMSMMSEDVKPSRIVRARLKIADVLRQRKDGQTALVVYAGYAHTVTPLSDDSATIVSLLPALQPNIMPSQGSNTEAAIERGIQLLHDAGVTQGNLLLVTDGVVPEAFPTIQQLLATKKIHLNILGVGSNQPAPIASGKGGFIRDQQGTIITTQLNSDELGELAKQVSGRYIDIANTDKDINYLTTQTEQIESTQATLQRDFDQWFDQGYWLVFLILPIALFSFKRGFLLSLIFVPMLGLMPKTVYAFSVDDLWLTKDQQAQRALNSGDAKKAAEQFVAPDWKATSQYRAGDYAAAAESYAKLDSATAHYNRGNALAKSGKLEDAIKAYDQALTRDANLADAKKNRALVEKALKDKKEQQQSDKNNKDKNQDEQNKGDQEQDKSEDKQKSDQQSDQQKESENNQEQGEQNNSSAPSDNSENTDSQSSHQSSAANTNSQSSSSAGQAQPEQQGQQSSSASGADNQPNTQSSNASADSDPSQAAQAGEIDPDALTDEQKQALEQWLRRVPDDPGGLLRNKFNWQYQQNRHKRANGEYEPPKNNADQRW